jgi:hypothetical protein
MDFPDSYSIPDGSQQAPLAVLYGIFSGVECGLDGDPEVYRILRATHHLPLLQMLSRVWDEWIGGDDLVGPWHLWNFLDAGHAEVETSESIKMLKKLKESSLDNVPRVFKEAANAVSYLIDLKTEDANDRSFRFEEAYDAVWKPVFMLLASGMLEPALHPTSLIDSNDADLLAHANTSFEDGMAFILEPHNPSVVRDAAISSISDILKSQLSDASTSKPNIPQLTLEDVLRALPKKFQVSRGGGARRVR